MSAPVPAPHRIGVAMLCGGLLAFALTLPKALLVATTGIFLNPDDAMRAVEVRAFMAGQPWFDLVPHRLSPDHPFVMHWSRLIDCPLALMIGAFDLVLPPEAAERATRLTEPGLLFLASLWLTLRLVRDLAGSRALLPAALLLAGSTLILSTFIPGHIHHHAAQLTLLLGATALMIRALGPAASGAVPSFAVASGRAAAGAGAIAALSLGIGLQSLPFVIGLAAIAGAVWVARGAGARVVLAGFAGGLGLASIVVFALDVPPSAYGEGACDAFSTAHLLAGVLGGGLGLALAWATPRLRSPATRLIAAAGAGLVLLGALRAVFPACLHDPMAGVDPLLREAWLAGVGEALPLGRLIAVDPAAGLALALTLACGVAATGLALVRAPAAQRVPWGAIALLACIGLLGTLYQVRVAASACALLVPGVAWSVRAAFERLARRPRRPALLAAVLLGLVGNGVAWSALAQPAARVLGGSGAPSVPSGTTPPDPLACFAPAAYDALKALPQGLVLSTIDPGSAILAATPHDVLAAPYHRNTEGNRLSLLAFAAPPDAAQPLVAGAGVTYVALCRSSNEAADIADRHPGGLAAALLAGRIPSWLTPLGTGAGPILLYQVARDSASP